MFNHLRKANLAQIEAMSDHFGEIYFHGCGNIYHDKVQSDNAKIFSNESNAPQTYRLKFRKGDKYPTSIEDLVKLLHKAKAEDISASKDTKESSLVTTFVMPKDQESGAEAAAGDDTGASEQNEGADGAEAAAATKGGKGNKVK